MTDIARVVIDTQIWIDVYLQKHIMPPPKQPYRDIVEALSNGEFIPVYSQFSHAELLRMLTTSRRVAQGYGLNPTAAGGFVGLIFAKLGEEVVIPETLVLSSDLDDNPIIETAIVGRVDYLVADEPHFHEPAVIAALRAAGIPLLYSNQFRKELRRRREAAATAEAAAEKTGDGPAAE